MLRTLVSRTSCVFAAVFASLSLVGSSLAQSGTTGVQSASPTADQYGVGFDGSSSGCVSPILSVAFNPGENVAPGLEKIDDVDLFTGGFTQNVAGFALPANTPRLVSISYNALSASSLTTSYQGPRWFQNSQPEIIEDESNGLVYLVFAADKYVAYDQVGSSAYYEGINGAAGFFRKIAATGSELELFEFTDHTGLEATFIGFEVTDRKVNGQLWRMRRLGLEGSTAYVGSNGTAKQAVIDNGWNNDDGRILKAFDSSGREFTYTYSTGDIGGTKRLASVVAKEGTTEVARVEYGYYTSTVSGKGTEGDLKTVKRTIPLSDSGVSSVQTTFFRYWTDTYNSSTNPGAAHQLMLVLSEEGVRRADLNDGGTLNSSHEGLDTSLLKPYASAYLEYDSSGRVVSALFNGQCGCTGGGTNGVHTISYGTNGSHPGNSGYDPDWKARAVVGRPDGSYLTQYFDEKGQTLSTVISDANPGGTANHWPTQVLRSTTGHVSEVWTPMAISSYTHSSGAFAANTSSPGGLVRLFTRETSGSAIGYLTERRFANSTDWGDSDWDNRWFEHVYTWDKTSAVQTRTGIGSYIRPLLASSRSYWGDSITSGVTDSDLTSYAYVAHSAQTLAVKKVTETQPAVSTSNTGSGSTHNIYSQLRADGQLELRSERIVEPSGTHVIEWRKYTTDGQLSERISDADTSSLTGIDDEFKSVTGALDDSETFTYDDQGRQLTHTTHDERVEVQYWSKIGDARIAHISYPHYVTSPSTKYYGPASYSILNHAGKPELEATLPFTSGGTSVAQTSWIDEGDSDPITALGASTSFATPTNIRTTVHDASGMRRTKSREYFLTPSTGEGTSGTNFDETTYAYDGMGRLIRTQASHETIWRSDYDKRGNVTKRFVGTNDTGLDGSTSSGTYNMVQTDEIAFDANGRVTSSTAYLTSTVGTPSRVTSYTLDLRGRRILTTNPTAPHELAKLDNLGRRTAVGLYSSVSSLTGSSNPLTEDDDRLALSETLYDERGQVWKTVHHKIDATDGSDDDTLESLTWFDEMGRVVKVDGEQLAKYSYDRLGQRTHEFILATDDDTTFTHVLDVTNDKVLKERQSVYDSGHRVWMTATISRLHGDTSTTGALDTDNGANTFAAASSGTMKGRIQITAYWFDELSREIERAELGTNDASSNGGAYNRTSPGTVPARSADVLVTSTEYDDAGRVKWVEDPKEQLTRFHYDDAGRTVAEVSNYDENDQLPANELDSVSNWVRYVYADGLMTKLWVDLDGDGVIETTSAPEDQVTEYTYGTTKGGSAGQSQIATGHLLQKETYPDSASGTDVVTYAYNAQSELTWKKDQAGNIIETEFDGSGRLAARKVTTLITGFDGYVKRIGHAYDDLGRTESVTQYSDAAGTTALDSVEYTYDGWGNLAKFNQDALGNGGWRDIEYTRAKATTGRNTLRRTAAILPNDQEYRYLYSSSSSIDDAASRVTNVADVNGTPLATYSYLGVGHVVKTYLEEPDAYSSVINSNSTAYDGLDQFNRPIKSRWTKDLSTDVDFFSVNVGWDRASNVQHQDDQVQVGHDTLYANDARNRLTDADEGTITIGTPSTIGSGTRTRRQAWVLTQTGNWSENLVDFNNDGDGLDAGELEETRVHNTVNELQSRDTNSSSPVEFNLTYDAVGNMTTDNENYQYKWDAFGRLREVKNLSSNVVSEYWYNGLGYLTVRLQDTNLDGVADSTNDRKYVTIYDERWRQVATYRVNPSTGALDANPKEQFVYHAAGNGGWGGSSYIDSVISRHSVSNSWTAAGASTLSVKLYYCQNWRADVVALLDEGGGMVQGLRYSAYGVPFGIPYGDVDADGVCNGVDAEIVNEWIIDPIYDVRGDLDLDGDVDTADYDEVVANDGDQLGYGGLSTLRLRNRKGYAGYEGDSSLSAMWHVRHRVLESRLGRWLRRDPLGYIGGPNSCSYGDAVVGVDPLGLDVWLIKRPIEGWFLAGILFDVMHYSIVVTEGDNNPGDDPASERCWSGTQDVETGDFVVDVDKLGEDGFDKDGYPIVGGRFEPVPPPAGWTQAAWDEHVIKTIDDLVLSYGSKLYDPEGGRYPKEPTNWSDYPGRPPTAGTPKYPMSPKPPRWTKRGELARRKKGTNPVIYEHISPPDNSDHREDPIGLDCLSFAAHCLRKIYELP